MVFSRLFAPVKISRYTVFYINVLSFSGNYLSVHFVYSLCVISINSYIHVLALVYSVLCSATICTLTKLLAPNGHVLQ